MYRRALLFAALFLAPTAPALAGDPPYLKLAQDLGTPELAYSFGTPDKSQLLLEFVPKGETAERWTKMTTVTIARVAATDTREATRGVIGRLRTTLAAQHAHVLTFDVDATEPVTAYFEFAVERQRQTGVVYSPAAGFVTVAQIGSSGGGAIAPRDVAELKSIVHRATPRR